MFEKTIRKMGNLSVFDWAILKICIAFLSLMIATLIPALVQVRRWIYGIIVVLAYGYTIWRLFIKK